ncbi:hypothetical protein OEZ86_008554 [Tetradesmus obliquus]|nr:hypothetical protein OEZ86_008554 [Tetradesmus obliquus]
MDAHHPTGEQRHPSVAVEIDWPDVPGRAMKLSVGQLSWTAKSSSSWVQLTVAYTGSFKTQQAKEDYKDAFGENVAMLANRLAVPFASNLLARVDGCIAGKRRPAEQSSATGIAWLLLT